MECAYYGPKCVPLGAGRRSFSPTPAASAVPLTQASNTNGGEPQFLSDAPTKVAFIAPREGSRVTSDAESWKNGVTYLSAHFTRSDDGDFWWVPLHFIRAIVRATRACFADEIYPRGVRRPRITRALPSQRAKTKTPG